jgi:hypothetical protein
MNVHKIIENFPSIITGWRNELIPPKELKKAIEELSEARLSFCIPCDQNSTPGEIHRFSSRCNHCGCWLKPKTKSPSEECPLGKWQAVSTLEEDNEIEQKLKDEPGT